jgi:glutamate synthase domain-containing protein 1
MCGIVGLFLKDKSLEPKLGQMLTDMLITMTDRGPDSAGIAIYGTDDGDQWKLTVQSANPDADFEGLGTELGKAIGAAVSMARKDTHAVLEMPADKIEAARAALKTLRPRLAGHERRRHHRNLQGSWPAQGCGRPLRALRP